MEMIGRLLILGMSVTFMLLAYQVDNVTGVFGWVFGTILAMALLASFAKKKGYPGMRGD